MKLLWITLIAMTFWSRSSRKCVVGEIVVSSILCFTFLLSFFTEHVSFAYSHVVSFCTGQGRAMGHHSRSRRNGVSGVGLQPPLVRQNRRNTGACVLWALVRAGKAGCAHAHAIHMCLCVVLGCAAIMHSALFLLRFSVLLLLSMYQSRCYVMSFLF